MIQFEKLPIDLEIHNFIDNIKDIEFIDIKDCDEHTISIPCKKELTKEDFDESVNSESLNKVLEIMNTDEAINERFITCCYVFIEKLKHKITEEHIKYIGKTFNISYINDVIEIKFYLKTN